MLLVALVVAILVLPRSRTGTALAPEAASLMVAGSRSVTDSRPAESAAKDRDKPVVSSQPPASVAAPALPAPSSPEPGASTVESEQLRTVQVQVRPGDARIYDGKQKLGVGKVEVKLAPGEKKALLLEAIGYRSRKVVIDGSTSRVVVGMLRESAGSETEGASDKQAETGVPKSAAPRPAEKGKPWEPEALTLP